MLFYYLLPVFCYQPILISPSDFVTANIERSFVVVCPLILFSIYSTSSSNARKKYSSPKNTFPGKRLALVFVRTQR